MFLGWTFGVWGAGDTGVDRADFMNKSMTRFWGNP